MRAHGAPEPQTLIVLSADPDTILVPSGENTTDVMWSLWAFVFSLSCSSLTARQANRRQFLPRRGDFEGSDAPKSQTLIVPSADPDMILVPSGENTTDRMVPLWALVFSATKLMSFAIILRTREKRAFGGMCIRQHGDMGPHTAASSKGASRVSTQTSNSQQRAARMRGLACGVWLRSSSQTESRMPSREAAQLGVSGLGSHVAVKRAGAERKEADWSAARDCGRNAKRIHTREIDEGRRVGARACVP